MKKAYTEDKEEALKRLDKMYENFKDKIPNIFNERFKILTCLVGAVICLKMDVKEEEDFLKRAQHQIDELQKELDFLKVYLKEYREASENE